MEHGYQVRSYGKYHQSDDDFVILATLSFCLLSLTAPSLLRPNKSSLRGWRPEQYRGQVRCVLTNA